MMEKPKFNKDDQLGGGENKSSPDSKGEVNMEAFEKQMNDYMKENLARWYREDRAEEANLKMLSTPLGEMDYEAMCEPDTSKFGEYSVNPDRTGTNYIENKEIPKIKILDMEEFIGKPTVEVMKAVVEKYGASYRIPDMEDEQYILSLPADKLPEEMKKDSISYYFLGSTFRLWDGPVDVPILTWFGSRLSKGELPIKSAWATPCRVLLLEK